MAQVDAVGRPVTRDSGGKILAVNIDTVQCGVPFTAEGKLASTPPTLNHKPKKSWVMI